MSLNREKRAYAARILVLATTIGHADLTDTDNGDDQSIELGTLPEGAIVLGYDVEIVTPFSGGSVSTLALDIGEEDDPDSIAADISAMAAAGLKKGTAGARPDGAYGGKTLVANFDPDGGHNLAALTAGSLIVSIYYAKPDVLVER